MGHEFLGVVEEIGTDVRTGFWAENGIGGGQAGAIRVPQADGTLVTLPAAPDSALPDA